MRLKIEYYKIIKVLSNGTFIIDNYIILLKSIDILFFIFTLYIIKYIFKLYI